jgi:formate hydrogenlyase subunit 3/multisubunit Na+/H+ antiporter MnhD subunit
LFFAMMSFASYPLVIHRWDREARRAGRVYIVLVVAGEAALLAAMLLSAVARGSLLFDQGAAELAAAPSRSIIIGLLLIGFGIKAGVVPLHVWLPLAHPAAPTPASAVLSGAMIKAGLLGWMRFLPIGEADMPVWGQLCLTIGLLTAFYGVVVGVTQRNAKTVLAYSSISQMGLLTLGIGGGLLAHSAWPAILPAVVVFALHHGLSKGCLFLSVGVAPGAAGTSWRGRLLQAGLVIPALALAGAPLTMGAVSKSALKYSLAALPDFWVLVMDILLPLSSVGTTLLMARFLYLIWPRSQQITATTSPSMAFAWMASLITVVGAGWLVPDAIGPKFDAVLHTVTWANLWQVCLGGGLAYGMASVAHRWQTMQCPAIPAGDMLLAWMCVQRVVGQALYRMAHRIGRICVTPSVQWSGVEKSILRQLGIAAEASLASLAAMGIALLIVGTCLLLMAA